ncbi:NAD(P)/FAD-dependent oxidoreductase [Spirosoma rhododendri]|uniref:FAD-dependent oxidoreductase n=1 Tax=Spirosoma rhododendri TaxID=2728024 RepID=A0A7L5DRK9_9BACT|nr:FAD-dependent oxidoreductase [Spirosoma rhododendri]QJD79198.1 FAD-dependent oxidoreductase [Spirosoma rhododendri]
MSSCIIIGAGMAGLTAAQQLAGRGWRVTVLDKGRGVGGRLATRRLTNGRADHGAQVIRAESAEFRAWLTSADTEAALAEWPVDPAGTGWIGRDGMNRVAKQLADGLTIETEQTVTSVHMEPDGWRVETKTGQSFQADALLCIIPAPQALTLFGDASNLLRSTDRDALQQIQYEPCLSVLVTLNQSGSIPAPGGLWLDRPDIAWLADNQQKGISPDQPTATILASTAFSQTHLDGDLNAAGQQLLAQLTDYLPAEAVADVQVHRWRYSQVTQAYPEPFHRAATTVPLLFGGDGFGGAAPFDPHLNVERAFLSGRRMADALLA